MKILCKIRHKFWPAFQKLIHRFSWYENDLWLKRLHPPHNDSTKKNTSWWSFMGYTAPREAPSILWRSTFWLFGGKDMILIKYVLWTPLMVYQILPQSHCELRNYLPACPDSIYITQNLHVIKVYPFCRCCIFACMDAVRNTGRSPPPYPSLFFRNPQRRIWEGQKTFILLLEITKMLI